MESVVSRFLQYSRIDTQSDDDSSASPSTAKQFDLARLLEAQLREIGCQDIHLTEHCVLYATIPPSPGVECGRTIGLIAHMDTSPEAPGANVNPIIHRAYAGGDIVLKEGTTIRAADLQRYVGQDIITSDGTTLIGADDKAGVAAIMDAAAKMMRDPVTHRHGRVRICFTPDEEIGRGTDHVEVSELGCNCAYTIDGGRAGEFEDETFNAVAATIRVKGFNVHPGTAYGIMVNAIRIVSEITAALPAEFSPETTRERQGFIHPTSIEGDVSEASLKMILRDFSMQGIRDHIRRLEALVEQAKRKHPKADITLQTKEQYSNMKPLIDEVPEVCTLALAAIREAGVTPIPQAVRGGTDGSHLTFNQCPTPNIFSGGENFHSKAEFLPIPSLERAAEVCLRLCALHAACPGPIARKGQA